MGRIKSHKYLKTTRKRFDPLALGISTVGLVSVLFAAGGVHSSEYLLDMRGLIIVLVGTCASLIFQFDFSSTLASMKITLLSFLGTPDKKILNIIRQLDQAITQSSSLVELRDGREINGELLNDIVYMYNRGLLYEEIEEFITSRISDEFLQRQVAVSMLNRAAIISPALGLFGTVVGLIGVLKSLSHPGMIGPSMSLALMTTAYGAGLASLIFTPLSGRLEHHNQIYLEIHKQLLGKVGILLRREERNYERTHTPDIGSTPDLRVAA